MGASSSTPKQSQQKVKKLKHNKVKFYFLYQPHHVQLLILEKLSASALANLAKCSKPTLQLIEALKPQAIVDAFAIGLKSLNDPPRVCINSKSANKDKIKYDHRLQWLKETKQVRVVPKRIIIEGDLDDDYCQKIMEDLGNVQASVLSLQCRTISCQQELFGRLLQRIQVSGLHCFRGIDWLYLQQDAVKKMDRLVIFDPRVYNETLLSLNATILYLNVEAVTVHGLNRFLAEWQEGQRTIKLLRVFNKVDDVEMLTSSPIELKAKKVWTKRYHQKLGSLCHWKWSRPELVYKIRRSMDKTVLFIAIWEQQVKVMASSYLKKYKELCFESVNI